MGSSEADYEIEIHPELIIKKCYHERQLKE